MNERQTPLRRRIIRAGLVLLAVCGLALCLLLIRMGLPEQQVLTLLGSPICAPTARVNCDYVLASRWSKIGPIPVAAFGAVYFAGLLCWFGGVGLPNRAGRRWHWLPLGACAVGLGASAYFFYVMAARLPVWCHLCLGVHAINALVFVLCIAGYPRRGRDDEGRMTEESGRGQGAEGPRGLVDVAGAAYPARGRALAVLGLTLTVGWAAFMTLFSVQMKTVARRYQLDALAAMNNADYIIWRYREALAQEIPLEPDDQVLGKLDGPYSIVVFSDFECLNCAGFHRYAYRLTQLFPDAARIVFKHYPLSSECNVHAKTSMHYFSCEAAEALEAARRAGNPQQIYRFQQALFENRHRLDERPYEELALAAGIERDAWRMAVGAAAGRERIRQDVELAHRLGVEGTPAIFINGRRLPAWNILTTDASPVVDLAATDALWEKLMHTKAKALPK